MNLSGEFTGSATIRGTVGGVTVYGPHLADLTISLAQVGGGAVQGVAVIGYEAMPGVEQLRAVQTINDGGRLNLELLLRLCGENHLVELRGTVNPANTINVAGATLDNVCAGGLGTLTVDPFELVR